MTYEEFEKKIAETRVTITQKEFLEAVSECMAKDMRELIEISPALMLAFTMFGKSLAEKIFEKESEDKE